jgi:hypothetical protein
MSPSKLSRPLALYLMCLCLLSIPLTALPAGLSMINDPSGSTLDMETAWLRYGPFTNYFIPGLFLFFVNRVGSLLVALALWFRPRIGILTNLTRWTHEQWPWAAALTLGIILVLWILIQYSIMQMFSPLQLVVGGIGLAVAILDLSPATRRYFRV